MFEFEVARNVFVFVCGLNLLLAVFSGLFGGWKGFLTFIILLGVNQVLPSGFGLLLLAISLLLAVFYQDESVQPDGRKVRDYGVNVGAALYAACGIIGLLIVLFLFGPIMLGF